MIVSADAGHHSHMVDVASAQHEAFSALTDDRAPSDIEKLLRAHFAFIWRLFRRMGLAPADADDATQQVFMIAATKLDRIVPNRERPFLYGIALKVHGHARRAATRRREVPADEREVEAPGPRPDQQVELERAWRLLDELLDKLPDKLRRVLVLAEIEGLEVSEIAACEGIPLGTAASRLRLGRARFRSLLAKHRARIPWGGSR